MIKWPITYTNYNGETVTEDYYFNLNKAELIQMQFDANGAYSTYINRIVDERDFKTLGQEFRKSDELRDEFEQSEAYATLYFDLLNDTDKMTKFIQGVLPAELREASQNNMLPA